MDAYPCPACGGHAVEPTGCPRCGRAHDPQAAALAVLNRRLAALERGSPERARLWAQAEALRAALRAELAREAAGRAPYQRAAEAPVRAPREEPVRLAARSATATAEPPAPPAPPQPARARPAVDPAAQGARNTMLALGGVLLGIPAVVVTVLSFTAAPVGGRAAIIGVATLIALAVPLFIARQTLTATAETLAGLGLLAVPLDGYLAYSVDLLGLGSTPLALYSSVLCGLVAAIAAGYRLWSHLRAPQFATLIAVQPVLPLLAAYLGASLDQFAVVFAVVAALNLGSVELLARDPGRLLRAVLARVHLPGLAPGPGNQPWPRRLRELAWAMLGVTLVTSAGIAAYRLAIATAVPPALRAAAALTLAVAVGVAGGLLARRPPLGNVAGAGATLILVLAFGHVAALARPREALALSSGVAAVVCLACSLLPRRARQGPRWGSVLAAGFNAGSVLATGVVTVAWSVRASITPAVWNADISHFVDGAPLDPADASQVVVAAALLTLVAVAGVPGRWRSDALIAGLTVVLLAVAGTGRVPWWGVPVLAWALASAAIGAALPAAGAGSVAIRAGCAGLLTTFAVATGLARTGLTALTCTLVGLTAAVTMLVAGAGRSRLGPYAARIGDAAAGVGACALPAAVGAGAHLAGAPGSLLVPVTLLATALGITAAMLSQVATRRAGREPGSAGGAIGALGAAIGALLVAVLVPGAARGDLAVAVLLGVAAVIAVLTRSRPVDQPVTSRVSYVDGPALAAAFATTGLVLALARLGAQVVPGMGLVVTAATVLVVAVAVTALPRTWRDGPRWGATVVGAAVVALASGIAVVEAARTVAAVPPYWHTDLGTWSERVGAVAPYGGAIPVSLLLAALAALLLVPAPAKLDVFFVVGCLAALAVPAVTAGPWWTAPLYAGTLAGIAGISAATTTPEDPPGTHQRRLGFAGLLAAYAMAAGAVTPKATAIVLFGLIGAAFVVCVVAALHTGTSRSVPGIAAAFALAAGPAAAACLCRASGVGRLPTLGIAVGACATGVVIVMGLRLARLYWDGYPGLGVGLATLVITAFAAYPDPSGAPIWAATGALLATIAAGHSRRPPTEDGREAPPTRVVIGTVAVTVIPAAAFAAALSTRAWVAALIGPFETLHNIWGGYPVPPAPQGAVTATVTLLLIAPTSGGIAMILGGRRFLLAAVLPPLAAAAVVLPAAFGAAPQVVPWVALGVALAAGLGAALSSPEPPAAAAWLRGTAAAVCGLAGAAGLAGSLATRSATLVALAMLGTGALAAGLFGRDPIVRIVAWMLVAGSGLGLPPLAVVTYEGPLVPPGRAVTAPTVRAAFGMLIACALLVALAWGLSKLDNRGSDAAVMEAGAAIGAAVALALVSGSTPHSAAALTVCGVLLGGAALRHDRTARARVALVWAGLAAEVGACWLLLFGLHIGLTEAYTLPFAVAALLAGAIELRRRPTMSSWLAYGPGLAGAFLPTVVLVIVGEDRSWRWAAVFFTSVAIVIVGSLRGWGRAPVFSGFAVAVIVAVFKMIWLLHDHNVAGALMVGLAGALLILVAAFVERGLRRSR